MFVIVAATAMETPWVLTRKTRRIKPASKNATPPYENYNHMQSIKSSSVLLRMLFNIWTSLRLTFEKSKEKQCCFSKQNWKMFCTKIILSVPFTFFQQRRVITSPSSLFLWNLQTTTFGVSLTRIWIQDTRSLRRYIGAVIQGPKDPQVWQPKTPLENCKKLRLDLKKHS